MGLYLAGGCEFERSSDTWKLPTMAAAGLRGEIEMVLKKYYYFQQQLQAYRAEREARAGIMERDKRAGEDTTLGMAIAGAVTGEGAQRMQSGTELPPPGLQSDSQAPCRHPSLPLPSHSWPSGKFLSSRHNSSHLASEQINIPSV